MSEFDFKFEEDTIEKTRALILKLSKEHMEAYSEQEKRALGAGKAIKNAVKDGANTKENLRIIYDWKQESVAKRFWQVFEQFDKNTEEDISDALKLAVSAQTDRSAVAVLLGLGGVQVPVASAILAMIYPEKYTIIDRLALRALNKDKYNMSVDLYLRYLNFCRAFAKRHVVTLRQLDHALWTLGAKKVRSKK